MSHPIQVGLVGYGLAGKFFHAPFLVTNPHFQLKSVVERHHTHSKTQYPWVTVVRSLDQLLDDPEIELVVIATPNPTHFEMAQKALNAQKHVVVDKPITATSQEAQTLIDLSRQQDRVLSVYQNRRWDGGFLTLKKVLESGVLGRLVHYESHFELFRNDVKTDVWAEQASPASGLLYGLGVHLLDQVQSLFGLPQRLHADVRQQRDGSLVDDQFSVYLDYGDFTATTTAGMLVREPGPHLVAHGTQGSFVKFGRDTQEEALFAGRLPNEANWGTDPESDWGLLNTEPHDLHLKGKVETLPGAYQNYYENIYQVIRHHAELIVTPEQARHTIRMIELAKQSSVERRSVSL